MDDSSTTATLPHYRSDQPVTDPSRDAYSRRAFADGLAKSIVSLPRDECYVIGLHGPWGDGKTSVLRFVEHTLKSHDSTVIAWFNPWRFLHEEAMLSEFFGVLAASVNAELRTSGEKWAARFARIFNWASIFDDRASRAASVAAEKAEAKIEKQRERLRAALERSGRRLVVFIDDIDRLDSSEVAALFRLIKACADLPNVIYVLAFDREMVARTLGATLVDGDAEAGRKFLDKIVQIPVTLPHAARRDLDRACMRGLQEVLESVGLTLSDSAKLRWELAYQEGVARRLKTPRHVVQYLNAVRFAIPLMANEVNTVDLLLVEALRICYAPAYEAIRSNQNMFIGVPIGEPERRNVASPQDDLLAKAKEGMEPADADALERLVEAMFPRYHFSRMGLVLGYESVKQWTHMRLVCSPAYGPRYFAYAIGSSDVADADINAILNAAASRNSTQLRTLLDKQLEPLKQTMLVSKLSERCQTIPEWSARRIAVTLATLSDRFDEPFSLQERNHPGVEAAALAVGLCMRFDSYARNTSRAEDLLDAFIDILNHSKEMWFASAFMRIADPGPPDWAEGAVILWREELPSIRAAFISRYERHAKTGHPQLDLERRWKFETLFCVARAGSRQLVHDCFVPGMRSNGNTAIRMLQLLAQPPARSGEIIPTPGDFGADELEALALLVDVDEMAEIVNEKWLSEDRRKGPADWAAMNPDDRVLAQFWHVYTQRA